MTQQPSTPASTGWRSYINVTGYPFPLGPLTSRRTIRREVDKGRIWVFEQPQVGRASGEVEGLP